MAGLSFTSESSFTPYAQALAASVFADKQYLTGPEIRTALSEKQINLFVLLALKERWEKEAQGIRSPYFNYENEVVQEAQKKFLNTLSQHIRFTQEVYTDLLTEALHNAWSLASAPVQFLTKQTEKMAKPSIEVAQVQGFAKYVVYHADLLQHALKDLQLTGRNHFLKGDFQQQLLRIQDRQLVAERNRFQEEFSYFLSTLGILEETEEREVEALAEPILAVQEPEDFFSQTLEEAESLADADADAQTETETETELEKTEIESVGYEPITVQDINNEEIELEDAVNETPIEETSQNLLESEPQIEVEEEPEPIVDTQDSASTQQEVWPEAPAEEKKTWALFPPEDTKEESLGEALGRQQQTQNMYARVASAPTENLHSLIAIGERYMIVGALFGGDMAAYSLAISELNKLENLEAALHYIWDEIANTYGWNPESEPYKVLDAALRRKFAAV